MALCPGLPRVSRYQKKHSSTHHPDRHAVFISFFHLPRSIASSVFKLRAWQSFCTTSLDVLFGLPLVLEPSTSYSIHFFTQSGRKGKEEYLYSTFLHQGTHKALRHGSHSITCKQHHACLCFMSIHQMAPPQQLRQQTFNCSSLLISYQVTS